MPSSPIESPVPKAPIYLLIPRVLSVLKMISPRLSRQIRAIALIALPRLVTLVTLDTYNSTTLDLPVRVLGS